MLGLDGLLERDVELKRDAVEADRRARGLTYKELVSERGPLLLEYREAVQALMEAQHPIPSERAA